MELIPIKTRRIGGGDNIVSVLVEGVERCQVSGFRFQDIVVISSKAVATAEGRIIDLAKLTVSAEAKEYAKKCGLSEEFCQAVLEETAERRGKVVGSCPGALLTELEPTSRFGRALLDRAKPEALAKGETSGEAARPHSRRASWTILTANAGLDQSNIAEGYAVGWPRDPAKSVASLRKALETHIQNSKSQAPNPKKIPSTKSQKKAPRIAVILSDSCCQPRRLGVTAFALAVSGLDPHSSQKGKLDLFGKPLRITTEAVADQLATAANFLMGNAGESVPAVIIRDHGLPLSNFKGWVPGIAEEEDLFRGMA